MKLIEYDEIYLNDAQLCAIFNDDWEDLSNDEIEDLENYIEELQKAVKKDWNLKHLPMYSIDIIDEEPHCDRNSVSDLMDTVYKCSIVFMKG